MKKKKLNLKVLKETRVNLYLDQAAYAYREYFDQAGIQKLTEFYLSETGQAYAFGEQMTSDQKSNLTKFLAKSFNPWLI